MCSVGASRSSPTSTTCSRTVPFPEADAYEGFPMHEDGIGMARTFELEMHGLVDEATGVAPGFFAWVDGAPAEGYRAPRVVQPAGTVAKNSVIVGIISG